MTQFSPSYIPLNNGHFEGRGVD